MNLIFDSFFFLIHSQNKNKCHFWGKNTNVFRIFLKIYSGNCSVVYDSKKKHVEFLYSRERV